MRCDRIDFPPGGIAYRHTHPGPGIRRLLFGSVNTGFGRTVALQLTTTQPLYTTPTHNFLYSVALSPILSDTAT
jgi:hypothetical protein